MYDMESAFFAEVSRRELFVRGGRGAAGLVAAGSIASFLAACGGGGSKSSAEAADARSAPTASPA